MLSVTGIWIYIFLTTFLAGYGVMQGLTRYLPYRIRHGDTYLLCGLVVVTVYAQTFSLFGPVGMAANLLLSAACAGIGFGCRRKLCGLLRAWRRGLREKRYGWYVPVAIGVLFLLFAYGTSRGILHYDTGLYHAQSIRWLEEYGAVKGLGNLHCRLAYNSSSFALSALYGMAFLGGQSYHCAAGWLAFLLAKICLEIVRPLLAGRLRVSDFARVMGIYYLVNIFDEMLSPASDYFMVLLAFCLVIRWLDLVDERVREPFPYAMLCVLGVFLMTVKLSAALILLLTVHPARLLLRDKRWKETGIYLVLGIVTALPFFARNLLLSGWLIYPFTQIDLFDVRWKIPKGVADYDAREIQVWGRGYSDVARYEIPVREWLPGWFRSLAGSDKLLVIAAAAAVVALLVYAAGMAAGLWRRRWEVLLVQATVAASFAFWLGTSPLIRYGCVYVYLTPAVVFGGIYEAVVSGGRSAADAEEEARPDRGAERSLRARSGRTWREAVRLVGIAAAAVLTVYKCLALGRAAAAVWDQDHWLVQKDYDNFETGAYEIEGVVFYYPLSGDQVGYEAFPSAPVKAEIRFLGDGIGDGFMAAEEEK